MKKIVALLMILCSLFLWGCGKDNATQSANKDEALKIEMLAGMNPFTHLDKGV